MHASSARACVRARMCTQTRSFSAKLIHASGSNFPKSILELLTFPFIAPHTFRVLKRKKSDQKQKQKQI